MNHLTSFMSLLLQEEKTWLLASDKIYSVMAVLILIFALVIGYLVVTNRKVSQLERRFEETERKA
jgi:uncharacterized membrane protein